MSHSTTSGGGRRTRERKRSGARSPKVLRLSRAVRARSIWAPWGSGANRRVRTGRGVDLARKPEVRLDKAAQGLGGLRVLPTILRKDLLWRRRRDGVGKCLAVGIDARGLHGDEQPVEKLLRGWGITVCSESRGTEEHQSERAREGRWCDRDHSMLSVPYG